LTSCGGNLPNCPMAYSNATHVTLINKNVIVFPHYIPLIAIATTPKLS